MNVFLVTWPGSIVHGADVEVIRTIASKGRALFRMRVACTFEFHVPAADAAGATAAVQALAQKQGLTLTGANPTSVQDTGVVVTPNAAKADPVTAVDVAVAPVVVGPAR